MSMKLIYKTPIKQKSRDNKPLIAKYNEDERETAHLSKVKVRLVIYWTIVSAIAIERLVTLVKRVKKFTSPTSRSRRLRESQILRITVGNPEILP